MALLSAYEIAQDRAFANDNMPDTCRIERAGVADETTFDNSTGQYGTTPTRTLIYAGICRIQIRADINTNIVEPIELERQWAYLTSTCQLPIVGSEDVRTDDILILVSCEYDDALTGREFNIQAPAHKSHATVRRFRLREAVR